MHAEIEATVRRGNVREFNTWLEGKQRIAPQEIEIALGIAAYHNKLPMISLLNLKIGEENIAVNKDRIREQIYYAKCRERGRRHKGECVCFVAWKDYLQNYPDVFKEYFERW